MYMLCLGIQYCSYHFIEIHIVQCSAQLKKQELVLEERLELLAKGGNDICYKTLYIYIYIYT